MGHEQTASPEVMFLHRFFAAQHGISRENFTGELLSPQYFTHGRTRPSSQKWRAKMAWKAPKIVEVPCGMEINMYVSATRK